MMVRERNICTLRCVCKHACIECIYDVIHIHMRLRGFNSTAITHLWSQSPNLQSFSETYTNQASEPTRHIYMQKSRIDDGDLDLWQHTLTHNQICYHGTRSSEPQFIGLYCHVGWLLRVPKHQTINIHLMIEQWIAIRISRISMCECVCVCCIYCRQSTKLKHA